MSDAEIITPYLTRFSNLTVYYLAKEMLHDDKKHNLRWLCYCIYDYDNRRLYFYMIKLSTSNLLRESSQKINTRCLENCSTEAHFLTLHTLGNDSHIPYHVSYNSKNTALPVTSQKMKPFWATILSSLFPLHCNCNTILFCRFISVDK